MDELIKDLETASSQLQVLIDEIEKLLRMGAERRRLLRMLEDARTKERAQIKIVSQLSAEAKKRYDIKSDDSTYDDSDI